MSRRDRGGRTTRNRSKSPFEMVYSLFGGRSKREEIKEKKPKLEVKILQKNMDTLALKSYPL